ncbi:DUF47 family protein [Nemorincola caseinilytica]|uniref:DUF47 family protein n=1 Tax=Nemorincola caseinilytica TaxID=2054315 RepID=A0ABP8N5P1_9BACT
MLRKIFSFRNKCFFRYIDELAIHLQAMGSMFRDAMAGGPHTLDAHIMKMEEKERAVSRLVSELRQEVGQDLMSPFDREDMHYLSSDLKHTAGDLLHITRQVRSYMLFDIPPVTHTITGQYITAIEKLCTILYGLRDTGGLLRMTGVCTEIKQLLYHCDEQLDKAIADMVNDGREGIALIKIMDHFTALDRLLERTHDTVNVCESIIVKYS